MFLWDKEVSLSVKKWRVNWIIYPCLFVNATVLIMCQMEHLLISFSLHIYKCSWANNVQNRTFIYLFVSLIIFVNIFSCATHVPNWKSFSLYVSPIIFANLAVLIKSCAKWNIYLLICFSLNICKCGCGVCVLVC